MIESDLVEGLFELEATHAIIDKGFFGQEMQVLLKRLSDHLGLETSKEGLLGGLALKHGQHTPRDSHYGEVLLVVQVLV